MSRLAHDRFERVIDECYESLKPEVLATVRGKLAVDSLHPDPSDLEAAYNAAWHALYEQSRRDGTEISNLGGWLATITYRRAIDDIRRARMKYRAPVAVGESISGLGYEHDVDDEIDDRQRYHQWLMSVRLRLNRREQQAVSLCVLHEHSRREASEIMGIDIKRLDKIMVSASKKLGGLLESINRGEWCENQRSLMKAFAFGLHEDGGERHALAVAHLLECQACAAYVRSLRGLTVVMPAPTLLASAVGAGGGVLGGLTGSLVKGGAGTAAGGGGGATLLGAAGSKTAALCVSAMCAAGGAVVVVDNAPDAKRPAEPTAESRPAPRRAAATQAPQRKPVSSRPRTERRTASSEKRDPPDPKSQGAQEIGELGIEPQATSPPATRQAREASVPREPSPSEFGIEGP